MQIPLKYGLRWLDTEKGKVLQVRIFVFVPQGGTGQGIYDETWEDVPTVAVEQSEQKDNLKKILFLARQFADIHQGDNDELGIIASTLLKLIDKDYPEIENHHIEGGYANGIYIVGSKEHTFFIPKKGNS